MIESGPILCVVKAPMIPDVNVIDGSAEGCNEESWRKLDKLMAQNWQLHASRQIYIHF